jgi:hypothetical protein
MAANHNRADGSKREGRREKDVDLEGLPVVHPSVAGIDLGSETHWVCAPTVDRSGREVECFGATTPDGASFLKQAKM